MRLTLKTAVCLAPLMTLAACIQPPGHYDSHGNYHSSDKGYQGQRPLTTNATDDKDAIAYTFGKAGFYDNTGKYAGDNNYFGVPTDFLPPAGMCRLWLPAPPLSTQPPAAPCTSKYHLKPGAYVIYGG